MKKRGHEVRRLAISVASRQSRVALDLRPQRVPDIASTLLTGASRAGTGAPDWPTAAAAAYRGVAGASVAATVAPGCALCRPATMTRSPVLEAAFDDPLIAAGTRELQRAQRHLVVRADDECSRLSLRVVRHADLRHQERIFVHALFDTGAHEHSGQ